MVDGGFKGQGKLLILAVDMTGDGSLRDYDLEGGDEDGHGRSAGVSRAARLADRDARFAARNGLDERQQAPHENHGGDKQFTVRGIMQSGGIDSAFGGNLAIMDIYAAQKFFGLGRSFDRIDIGAERRRLARPGAGLAAQAAGAGLRSRAAGRARPAFRIVIAITR